MTPSKPGTDGDYYVFMFSIEDGGRGMEYNVLCLKDKPTSSMETTRIDLYQYFGFLQFVKTSEELVIVAIYRRSIKSLNEFDIL